MTSVCGCVCVRERESVCVREREGGSESELTCLVRWRPEGVHRGHAAGKASGITDWHVRWHVRWHMSWHVCWHKWQVCTQHSLQTPTSLRNRLVVLRILVCLVIYDSG
jgi:hypothetical protein